MTATNRLTATIRARNAARQGAFMPFLVLGDPSPGACLSLVDALVAAGADILEFGLPFSDPPADGPVIQAADTRALAAGVNTPDCFALLDEVKRRHDKPVALLVYANLIFQMGLDAFYARAAEAGVDGVLVADVPLEEAGPFAEAAAAHGVAHVGLATPVTPAERLARMGEVGGGYLYAVARLGTTGERTDVDPELARHLARFKAAVDLPVLSGFGISTPEHVLAVRRAGADGVIVGSALVRQVADHLDDPQAAAAAVGALARALAAAAHTPINPQD
ncbi:MAG: tryptophan synthase subunit alpha [Myxococcales bacterium]|nr:tryptophan synthase subunit alpha [Myxococcales bacterium]